MAIAFRNLVVQIDREETIDEQALIDFQNRHELRHCCLTKDNMVYLKAKKPVMLAKGMETLRRAL